MNTQISSRKLTVLLIVLTSLAVAYLDYLSPPEVPLDALYTVPIWLGLLVFGIWGGVFVATTSIVLYYVSNYLLQASANSHVILSVLLTYAMLLLFTYGAYLFHLNEGRLADVRKNLENRLEDLDKLNRQMQTLHEQNLKLAVMGERNRIAREIHDVLGQGFTGIILQVEAAQLHKDDPMALQERLEQIDQLARYNLKEARRSVADLRPLPLDSSSLMEVLARKTKLFQLETGIEAEFTSSGMPRQLSGSVEVSLYRIAQEALNNISRHSGASLAKISVDYDEEEICLTVQDNGKGFNVIENYAGNEWKDTLTYGLSSMQERTSLCGGLCTIQSSREEGTRVRVIIPYRKSGIVREMVRK